MFSGMLRYVVG